MWMRSKEWLEDAAGVQIPDSDTLHADACGPSYRYDSHTRLVLERKEDMRRRGGVTLSDTLNLSGNQGDNLFSISFISDAEISSSRAAGFSPGGGGARRPERSGSSNEGGLPALSVHGRERL
jgi:hypothetical protein